jgi:predicted enzyme related to lactoylglutathione lyase
MSVSIRNPEGSEMPVELGYCTIPVSDVTRARIFYGRLFGWTFEPAADNGSSAHVANTKLPLGLNTGEPADYHNLYFRVDNIAAAIALVRELGGSAEEPQSSPSGLSAACEDDQKTRFSLWQPAAGY